jgi:hypothetical protein
VAPTEAEAPGDGLDRSLGHAFLTPVTRAVAALEKTWARSLRPGLHFNRASGAAERYQALAATPFCFAVCVAMKSISPGDKQS